MVNGSVLNVEKGGRARFMAPVKMYGIMHDGGQTFGTCLYNEVREGKGGFVFFIGLLGTFRRTIDILVVVLGFRYRARVGTGSIIAATSSSPSCVSSCRV